MTKLETNVVKPNISFFENETDNLLLSTESEVTLDSRIKEVENFMSTNSGRGKSESEKDELYKSAQELWRDYANVLRDVKYNFYLTRPQWKFLTDLILQKLEYDVNTVFFAIELTDLLAGMKDTKFTDDNQLVSFAVDATEITYIYHLISKHKVKGLTKDSYIFANVLKRIGDISKVFNYYDTAAKNLSNEIQDWVLTFDESITLQTEEAIEGQVL